MKKHALENWQAGVKYTLFHKPVVLFNQEPCLNLTNMGQMIFQTMWSSSTVLMLCTLP